jgi:hypothetical protein
MADQPPLGHLTGMYYDHEKKRYFPYMAKPATAVPRTAADRRAMETFMRQPLMASANRNGTQQARDRKRGRREADLWDVSESPAATRRIRRSLGCRMSSSQSWVPLREPGARSRSRSDRVGGYSITLRTRLYVASRNCASAPERTLPVSRLALPARPSDTVGANCPAVVWYPGHLYDDRPRQADIAIRRPGGGVLVGVLAAGEET